MLELISRMRALISNAPASAPQPAPNLIIGSYSATIGYGMKVTGSHELAFGLGRTMATLHVADGAWSIDWSEVDRVAALDVTSEPVDCASVVFLMARFLQSTRGVIKEREHQN